MAGRPNGEPWQVMYSNVTGTLARGILLHKYPITHEETIDFIFQAESDRIGVELRKCIRKDTRTTFQIGEIVFWVAADPLSMVIATADPDSHLVVPMHHPHYDEIMAWAEKAAKYDHFLGEAKMYLNRTLKKLGHPDHVKRFWPEVAPYCGEPTLAARIMREPRPGSISVDAELQKEIVEQLTLCALINRDTKGVRAWIGSAA